MRGLISIHKYRAEADVLKAECDVFARYLVDHKPNAYVMAKYDDAHNAESFNRSLDGGFFDGLLLSVSRTSPLMARLVDTYTSVFCKKAVVRKKMILLLAILETCAPSFADFDLDRGRGITSLCLGIARQSATFGLTLLIGTLLFLPLQLTLATGSIFTGRNS